jgi:hypothetical protein
MKPRAVLFVCSGMEEMRVEAHVMLHDVCLNSFALGLELTHEDFQVEILLLPTFKRLTKKGQRAVFESKDTE